MLERKESARESKGNNREQSRKRKAKQTGVTDAAHASHEDGNLAIADMISLLAFFFLLRPGKYTGTNSETSPFCFCDVQLFVGDHRSRG